MVVAVALGITCGTTVNANASEYEVPCTEEENLATNEYNWLQPTLSSADFSVGENGIKMDNFIKDQQCTTYFRGGEYGEFKLSLLVNANLNVPAENKAQWRYSEVYITFLINRNAEDAVAEDSKPWYANKVYGSFCFGLTTGGVPISRFMYYNAFASNCSMSGQFYQPSGYRDVNVVDGKDHWIEIEVKNYQTEEVSGKKWTAYIDGDLVAEFDRDDDTYYDSDAKREFEVNYSALKGGIGIYTNSDWPAGYAPSKMNNFLEIKKAKLISYDEVATGKVVGQCQPPKFEIKSKEYTVSASYDAGDPIEIQLSDLFEYEGTERVNYEITCDGEPIGSIVNGFWAWTPTKAGTYDVDFKANITEENKAVNYLTIRVTGNADTSDSSEKKEGKSGCGSSITLGVLATVATLGFVAIKRKEN